jgi:hypothetical protein
MRRSSACSNASMLVLLFLTEFPDWAVSFEPIRIAPVGGHSGWNQTPILSQPCHKWVDFSVRGESTLLGAGR